MIKEFDFGFKMTRKFTEEEIKELEEEHNRRDEFLIKHGWRKTIGNFKQPWNGQEYKSDAWIDPFGNIHPHQDGYDQLTMILLREDGWRAILEIKHIGHKESKFHKKEEWGRFQSPRTGMIYSFLEAQYIMEQGWNEDVYPDGCSENTKELNRIAGNHFMGDTIETWFYINKKDGKHIHCLWEN